MDTITQSPYTTLDDVTIQDHLRSYRNLIHALHAMLPHADAAVDRTHRADIARYEGYIRGLEAECQQRHGGAQ